MMLKDLVPKLLNFELNWKLILARDWPLIMGSLKTQVCLEKVLNDTIVIGVYESHWMQELYLLSSVLRDSINKHLGEPKVNHIRFKLVPVRNKERVLLKPETRKNLQKVPLTVMQKKALECIPDDTLKDALIHFWHRCTSHT